MDGTNIDYLEVIQIDIEQVDGQNVFATPGIDWSNNLNLVNSTIDMIELERTDSLYIVDAPDLDIPLTVGQRTDVTVANDIVDSFDVAALDTSYAATYYPWVQHVDSDNSTRVYIPPTAHVVKAIAFTDNVKFPWFAVAGLQRGVTDAVKSKYKMSAAARDILYAGRINPMADFNDVGTAIFGQKTMQVKESALDRINVRRLLLQAKVLLSNVAIRLVFEQNDQTTIDQFLSKANPLLDTIRRERGLQEFQIKMDDSNNSPESKDRNELFGEIKLKPTRAVEYIGLTFTITPSGASFEDI
jgi:phage tail sheath protein FI